MCCVSDTFPAKTLCRLFAFLNVFLGLLSLYYWELLTSFVDEITLAPNWESILSFSNEDIMTRCGDDYLKTVSPHQFGTIFKKSIHLYMIACIIFSVKGFVQFFITCCNPVLARSLGIMILVVDLFTTGIFLYGLHIFRSPQLCLLEHSDVFNYPGRQSQMTMLSLISLAILKPPEFLSLICFIRQQSLLISLGERRSKGVRRSEAFRTPMCSRANSFMGCYIDYEPVVNHSRQGQGQVTEEDLLAFQQMASYDYHDGDGGDEDQDKFNRNMDRKSGFVEIDLNENRNKPVTGKDPNTKFNPNNLQYINRYTYGLGTGQTGTTTTFQNNNPRNGIGNNSSPSKHDDASNIYFM